MHFIANGGIANGCSSSSSGSSGGGGGGVNTFAPCESMDDDTDDKESALSTSRSLGEFIFKKIIVFRRKRYWKCTLIMIILTV